MGRNVLPGGDDTIVALATPPGRSAIAVIRMSGLTAFEIGSRLLYPWPISPRTATLCTARDPSDGTLIDHLVVTSFHSPRSYTGDDTVELASHGGYAVPGALVSALVTAGARLAYPGEFTRRALLNGKIDLTQAEGIGDLIDASSDAMRRVALHQLDGSLSRKIADLRDRLLEIEALVAYEIDFPEEDDGPVAENQIMAGMQVVLESLDELLKTAPATGLVKDGAVVVIAGQPNAGKSSLFNTLVGEARAIVTELPGTTRDAIEVRIEADGWPLRLVDTAGLRSTTDVVERLGVEVSERYLAGAHVIVACGEDSGTLYATIQRIGSLSAAPVVAVLTKADRYPPTAPVTTVSDSTNGRAAIRVSVVTRMGLDGLIHAIADTLRARYGAVPVDQPALTRTRHKIAVEEARSELMEFRHQWFSEALPVTIAAVHLRAAVTALEEVIGAVDAEDVLERVFATFCVGK